MLKVFNERVRNTRRPHTNNTIHEVHHKWSHATTLAFCDVSHDSEVQPHWRLSPVEHNAMQFDAIHADRRQPLIAISGFQPFCFGSDFCREIVATVHIYFGILQNFGVGLDKAVDTAAGRLPTS
jgi:hypothetical protein